MGSATKLASEGAWAVVVGGKTMGYARNREHGRQAARDNGWAPFKVVHAEEAPRMSRTAHAGAEYLDAMDAQEPERKAAEAEKKAKANGNGKAKAAKPKRAPGKNDPLSVSCPTCKAKAEQRCLRPDGVSPLSSTHKARWNKVGKEWQNPNG